jgi:HEAT repeat protein
VRRALSITPLPKPLVGLVIDLLAWDAVANEALQALRSVCDGSVGQIVDVLLDPEAEFAVRRRAAQALGVSRDPRAITGLLAALDDPRFEVRFQAGVALARVRSRLPEVALDESAVLARIEREAGVNRQVWESQRLLDDLCRDESPFYDEVLRARSSRSLEHVFNMLSVVFPPQPLRIAYRGLYSEDRTLRGTALEYLEHILPGRVRDHLWPFLDDDRVARDGSRGLQQVVDDLVRSHESIQMHLDKLRGSKE